ncbi:large ribosomal subunit protein mL48 isoform X2 [Carettochelys insculpta]
MLLSCNRHYRSQPTHRIGRFKYLLPAEIPKKKRERIRLEKVDTGTDHEYGDLNIQIMAYDMCLVEHFAQYVHKLCNRFSIRVNESYALPTKTMEVMLVQEPGFKLYQDAILTIHRRIVQIRGLSSTFAPIFLEVIQSNQPEGVHLSVKEHTIEDFKVRLKVQTELEELRSRWN